MDLFSSHFGDIFEFNLTNKKCGIYLQYKILHALVLYICNNLKERYDSELSTIRLSPNPDSFNSKNHNIELLSQSKQIQYKFNFSISF